MPREPIDRLIKPFDRFLHDQGVAGILLFITALAALIVANSPWAPYYHKLLETQLGIDVPGFRLERSLHYWINDGLMAMFFFLVGLEIKREIVAGQLRDPRKAMLPLAAALGGMAAPALIYVLFNGISSDSIRGWGIPMATDIAFALGLMALLGRRVPLRLKVFLTTVAITDDVGSVLVIAFFYTDHISLLHLGVGAGALAVMLGANVLGIRNALFYGIIGIGLLWTAFILSGVHATIAGVLAALAIPARVKLKEYHFLRRMRRLLDRFERQDPTHLPMLTERQMRTLGEIKRTSAHAETPLQRLEQSLQPFVAFLVLPLFAFVNSGVHIPGFAALSGPVFPGVALGLVVGKPLGILFTCWLMVRLRWARLGDGLQWSQLASVAVLAGVGFTMSLFINELAFKGTDHLEQGKLGVFAASVIAGTVGLYLLHRSTAGRRAGKRIVGVPRQ